MNGISPAIIAIVAACVVLLIPVIQCCQYMVNIDRLDSQITEGKQENAELEEQIESLHETKLSEVVAAAERVADLEDRLERNRILKEQTEEAEEKLVLVKSLIAKHEAIVQEIEAITRKFPILLSEGK